MAAVTWEAWDGAGPAWTDIGSNRIVFSGSLSDLTATVAALAFQDGTHIGNGTPGTDQCGANHVPNNKLIDATHYSHNGGGSLVLNDTNLADNNSSFRLHFNDAGAFKIQNAKLYAFDGITITARAVGVDIASYVKYQAQGTWQTLNSDTVIGPTVASESFTTAGIGGYTNFQQLADQLTGAVDHYWYVAISASPEIGGGKSYALGSYFEYF